MARFKAMSKPGAPPKGHEFKKTGEKPFDCPSWGKCFGRKDLVQRHLQDFHKQGVRMKGTREKPRPYATLTPPVQESSKQETSKDDLSKPDLTEAGLQEKYLEEVSEDGLSELELTEDGLQSFGNQLGNFNFQGHDTQQSIHQDHGFDRNEGQTSGFRVTYDDMIREINPAAFSNHLDGNFGLGETSMQPDSITTNAGGTNDRVHIDLFSRMNGITDHPGGMWASNLVLDPGAANSQPLDPVNAAAQVYTQVEENAPDDPILDDNFWNTYLNLDACGDNAPLLSGPMNNTSQRDAHSRDLAMVSHFKYCASTFRDVAAENRERAAAEAFNPSDYLRSTTAEPDGPCIHPREMDIRTALYDPTQPLHDEVPAPPPEYGPWEVYELPGPLEPWIIPPPSPQLQWPAGTEGGRIAAVVLYFRSGRPHHTRIFVQLPDGAQKWWLLDEQEMKLWGLHTEGIPPEPIEG
ncbi:hypothetical protein BCR34DRAFT_616393 [Clohesyomyces aquaticus]|uniref:C2H2-type domain-containing protein n=1 Tax=Clohesyomyces aquaticus TaxID=1231657 RepID=A0A1Y1ZDY2_9PLEO|nr:hypothetical protein BCR34DRAFT_616393 [Clohesyomyces aquaticus]